MLIEPNTFVRLIRNCPLENSYKDTYYFNDHAEQIEFFTYQFQGINLTPQSYQRYDAGVMTVKLSADTIYDVNYMMFRNTSYGNRMFFAFVNNVEYVSNTVSRIYYEIDVVQTWLPVIDYELKPTFVERCHSRTDAIGDNLIPESIPYGDYTYTNEVDPFADDGLCVVVQVNADALDWEDFGTYLPRGMYGGVYNGVESVFFPIESKEDADRLAGIINAMDVVSLGGIIGMYMYPLSLATLYLNGSEGGAFYADSVKYPLSVTRPTTLDGYTPKNNKLLTYPYVCANLSANNSNGNDFAFERFYGNTQYAEFWVTAPYMPGASLLAYPKGYDGLTENPTYGVVGSPFPACAFAQDRFIDWFANNSLTMLSSAISGAIGSSLPTPSAMSVGALTEELLANKPVSVRGPKTAAKAEAREAAREGAKAKYIQSQINAENMRMDNELANNREILRCINGAISSLQKPAYSTPGNTPTLHAIEKGRSITAKVKTIRSYIAKIIDDYFTMYGYAQNKIMAIQFDNRSRFTYIKTVGYNAHGGAPADILKSICAIHDNGITYWKKESVVGDYITPNTPVD